MSFRCARLSPAATLLAATALVSTSVPALAATDSGVINVTGESNTVIELTISDPAADFGATMTPDGAAASVPNAVDPGGSGACYYWDGLENAQVRSNLAYTLSVDVTGADVSSLLFDVGGPAWAACTAGTPAVTAMYGAPWQSGSATSGDLYDTNLGIEVLWGDGPAVYDTTLTLTAQTTP